MISVATCLTDQHDLSMVLLAAAICASGSILTFVALKRTETHLRHDRRRWLIGAGATLGMTLWMTHYTAMLAYQGPLPLRFDALLTLASAVIALIVGTCALRQALRRGAVSLIRASLVLTIGISGMHFVGMLAIEAPARVDHSAGPIAAGFAAGLLLAAASLMAYRQRTFRGRLFVAAVFLVLAICAVHFAAMSGLVLVPDPAVAFDPAARSPWAVFGDVVAIVAIAVMLGDMRDRRHAEARIAQLAHYDALTGLPNRALLEDRLHHALASASRTRSGMALVTIDLDGFKLVNDLHGHGAGDDVLRRAAALLVGQVRGSDTVARMGGDEFVIIQSGIERPEHAEALVRRIQAAFEAEFPANGALAVGASMGIALYPEDGREAEVLKRNSDFALYKSKQSGRGCWHFFHPDMCTALLARRRTEQELRASIARSELFLVYQPLADTMTGEIRAYEALVRWRHPERGIVPPMEFITIAEQCGFILPLGAFVLREACRAAMSWPRPFGVCVNISPIQLQRGGILELVETVLAETGLAPSRLELEITETALIHDREATVTVLGRLRALGVRIVMDDFGTGYSSLNNLQSFPFDKIKIDRSFVMNLEADAAAQTIVRAIIGLGHGLVMPITAEGVETQAQLETLRALGCTEVQGYLIGRPAPTIQEEAVMVTAQ